MLFSLKTLAAIVAFTGVSYGATCEGGSALACGINDGALARTSDMWAARQDYCGNNRWKSTSCFRFKTKTVPVFIQNNKPGSNSQQTCWDALASIIQQCAGEAYGSYDFNGQRYRMGGCSNVPAC